ncbi:MAG: biopolymer transporter ExbD [Pseudomonadota bacterium]
MNLGGTRKSRKPSLTPMIDVVFLLLVFFMLAARFGQDMALDIALAGPGGAETPYTGPPRIIDVTPDGQRLNGVSVDQAQLAPEVARLTESPDDTIILRPRDNADLQRVLDVMGSLSAEGFTSLVLLE